MVGEVTRKMCKSLKHYWKSEIYDVVMKDEERHS
jgi:hypothetical protein